MYKPQIHEGLDNRSHSPCWHYRLYTTHATYFSAISYVANPFDLLSSGLSWVV